MLNQTTINYRIVKFEKNTLFYGDNLDILTHSIPDEFIDLIYLDPPFNSKADYNILFKETSGDDSTAQIQAFTDFWHWDDQARRAFDYLSNESHESLFNLMQAFMTFLGKNDMMAYLSMMGIRLLQLHRVLKSTGSIFLHCDPTASHYLKLLMDSIFGIYNFRNEIMWKRIEGHSGGNIQRFGRIHDIILFYSKSDNYKFHRQYRPYNKEYTNTRFPFKDKNGRRWASSDLRAPGIRHGESGKPWHGIDPSKKGLHWKYTVQKLDELEKNGKIYFTRSGLPTYIRYLDEMNGYVVQDIWDDISHVNSVARERLGFQTQKPEALLERIIESCSNPGDLILDPFCGCGTAVIAAEKLHRRWIGIDITWLAISAVKNRLAERLQLLSTDYLTEGEPRDMGAAYELAKKDRYQFQWWALSVIGARPVGSTPSKPRKGKRGADEGIDGWMRFADGPEGHVEKIVVQVKSGDIGPRYIRELRDVVSKQKAAIGIFLTLEEPTKEMIKEAKSTNPYVSTRWNREYSKIQILTIRELLSGKRPNSPTTFDTRTQTEIAKRSVTHRQETLFT